MIKFTAQWSFWGLHLRMVKWNYNHMVWGYTLIHEAQQNSQFSVWLLMNFGTLIGFSPCNLLGIFLQLSWVGLSDSGQRLGEDMKWPSFKLQFSLLKVFFCSVNWTCISLSKLEVSPYLWPTRHSFSLLPMAYSKMWFIHWAGPLFPVSWDFLAWLCQHSWILIYCLSKFPFSKKLWKPSSYSSIFPGIWDFFCWKYQRTVTSREISWDYNK